MRSHPLLPSPVTTHRRANVRCRRRGAAAVEFAVAFVVLLMFLFAGFECYRLSMLRHAADHAAYVGARAAMVPGASAPTVIATANAHLAAVGIHSASISLSPNPITEATGFVEVTVTVPVAPNSWIAPDFFAGDLIGRSRLITERAPSTLALSL